MCDVFANSASFAIRFGTFSRSDSAAELEFDENIFNVLLPLRDAWPDGHVETPRFFASPSLRERAFSELLFCDFMIVASYDDQLSEPFTSLPAVRECTSLLVLQLPSRLTSAGILEWLDVDARSKKPKYLEMDYEGLDESVETSVQQLKTVGVANHGDSLL